MVVTVNGDGGRIEQVEEEDWRDANPCVCDAVSDRCKQAASKSIRQSINRDMDWSGRVGVVSEWVAAVRWIPAQLQCSWL